MAEAQLPPGNQETLNTSPDAATEKFKIEVEKSKANLMESEAPAKRGRGRPPKKKSETAAPGADTPSSVTGPTPPPTDMSPYLIEPLTMISKIPAGKTGIPELALTPDEAAMCAHSINNLLNVFIPDVSQISPKSAAVISASTVFGAVFFQKYQIYLIKRKSAANPTPQAPKPEPVPEGASAFPQVNVGVDATEHFARKPAPASV